ncbi:hypothetical protein BCR43DRAFT_492000 [Syncephalastrum racemosum]|uniref:Small ribosomal subunit protein uS17c n=1 Tax=Syncephalastrum racemosum TaxID=13706 RepID=A0A1X2HCW2_SYNRA|nr:hypothetical protein BCR43DRAFT_492000 [Syncephalastrum racemosum]
MRQNFLGMVVSNAMQKTVKVKVTKTVLHPKVLKHIKTYKNYLVHDENQLCQLGDVVRIETCRPLSKHKHFTVSEIVRSANKGFSSQAPAAAAPSTSSTATSS